MYQVISNKSSRNANANILQQDYKNVKGFQPSSRDNEKYES